MLFSGIARPKHLCSESWLPEMGVNYSLLHVTLSFSVPAEMARSPLVHETSSARLWRFFTDAVRSRIDGDLVDEHRNKLRRRRIEAFFRAGLGFSNNFFLRPAFATDNVERFMGSRFSWKDGFLSDLEEADALRFSTADRMNWETKMIFDQPGSSAPSINDFLIDTEGDYSGSADYHIRNILAGLFVRTRTIISAPSFLKRHCFLWLPPGRLTMKTQVTNTTNTHTYVVAPVVSFSRSSDQVTFRRTFTVTVFFIPTDDSFSQKRPVTTDELNRLVSAVPRFPFFNQVKSTVHLAGDLAVFAGVDPRLASSHQGLPLHEWLVNVLCRKVFTALIDSASGQAEGRGQRQFIGSTLLHGWLISRIWSVVTVCDGDCWSVKKMNDWAADVFNHRRPEDALTNELITVIEEVTGYRVPPYDLVGKMFLDSFGLVKLRSHTTYLAFFEPERSAFLDFCPIGGEHYPFMSLYLLTWRLPMVLGLSSANALSNLFHHEISRAGHSKRLYQHVRDLVLEYEDAYDLDILLEAFRAQYANARKLEGVDRDYAQLTAESSILFQEVSADASRRSGLQLAILTWGLLLFTVVLSFEQLRPAFCYMVAKIAPFLNTAWLILHVCAE